MFSLRTRYDYSPPSTRGALELQVPPAGVEGHRARASWRGWLLHIFLREEERDRGQQTLEEGPQQQQGSARLTGDAPRKGTQLPAFLLETRRGAGISGSGAALQLTGSWAELVAARELWASGWCCP